MTCPAEMSDARAAMRQAIEEVEESPPRDEWRDREGFNVVSLRAWLNLCERVGIPALPAVYVTDVEIDALYADEATTDPKIATFWKTVEFAKQPHTVLRWDCCSTIETKDRLGHGQWEWSPDLLDSFTAAAFYGADYRAADILYEYPGRRMPVWRRPWMPAAIVDGYPMEFRFYVWRGMIAGISNYYPQRPLPDDEEVRWAMQVALAYTAGLLNAMPVPLAHQGFTALDPDDKSFTADFMCMPDGKILFLEAGPPFSPFGGAHPCCFEGLDDWTTTGIEIGDIPIALAARDA